MRVEKIGCLMLALFLLGVAAPGVEASAATTITCPNTYLMDPVTVPISFPAVNADFSRGHAWIFMEEDRDANTKTGSLTGRTCSEDLESLPCNLVPMKMDGVACEIPRNLHVIALNNGASIHYDIRIQDPI